MHGPVLHDRELPKLWLSQSHTTWQWYTQPLHSASPSSSSCSCSWWAECTSTSVHVVPGAMMSSLSFVRSRSHRNLSSSSVCEEGRHSRKQGSMSVSIWSQWFMYPFHLTGVSLAGTQFARIQDVQASISRPIPAHLTGPVACVKQKSCAFTTKS